MVRYPLTHASWAYFTYELGSWNCAVPSPLRFWNKKAGSGNCVSPESMAYRDSRGSRAALFEDVEEGGGRVSSAFYSSTTEIAEEENERGLDELQLRVGVLKRLTTDVHSEAESQNKLLDRMGVAMESSKGIMSGVMDRMTIVFSSKSNRKIATVAASFVGLLLLAYFLTK